jgi:hypothetical protein
MAGRVGDTEPSPEGRRSRVNFLRPSRTRRIIRDVTSHLVAGYSPESLRDGE